MLPHNLYVCVTGASALTPSNQHSHHKCVNAICALAPSEMFFWNSDAEIKELLVVITSLCKTVVVAWWQWGGCLMEGGGWIRQLTLALSGSSGAYPYAHLNEWNQTQNVWSMWKKGVDCSPPPLFSTLASLAAACQLNPITPRPQTQLYGCLATESPLGQWGTGRNKSLVLYTFKRRSWRFLLQFKDREVRFNQVIVGRGNRCDEQMVTVERSRDSFYVRYKRHGNK